MNLHGELEIVVADQLDHLMAQLPEATGRVRELRLQGNDVEEIAALVGRSPRTVRRQLETIRATFLKSARNENIGSLKRTEANQPRDLKVADSEANPAGLTSNRDGVEGPTLNDFVLRRQIGLGLTGLGLGLTGHVYEAFDKRHQPRDYQQHPFATGG